MSLFDRLKFQITTTYVTNYRNFSLLFFLFSIYQISTSNLEEFHNVNFCSFFGGGCIKKKRKLLINIISLSMIGKPTISYLYLWPRRLRVNYEFCVIMWIMIYIVLYITLSYNPYFFLYNHKLFNSSFRICMACYRFLDKLEIYTRNVFPAYY